MEDLIKALQILLKYGNPEYPAWFEHDTLHICEIDDKKVSDEDKAALEELGFYVDDDEGGFISTRFC